MKSYKEKKRSVRMKKQVWKRYEFSDGYVVCVKGLDKAELAAEERKHGPLRKIGSKFVFKGSDEK